MLDDVIDVIDVVDAVRASDLSWIDIALQAHQMDLAGVWGEDGSISMIGWLAAHARMARVDAIHALRCGRLLDAYAEVLEAARAWTITWHQLGLLARACTPARRELFERDLDLLVGELAKLSPADSVIFVRRWTICADASLDGAEPKLPHRSLRRATLDDGTTLGWLIADATLGAELDQALQTARCFDGPIDTRPADVRDADALFDILAFFNANHDRAGTPRHRPHVELGIQLPTRPTPEDGDGDDGAGRGAVILGFPQHGPAPAAATPLGVILDGCDTDAYLCDCVLHRVLRAGSAVLDFGHATRTVPTHLLRAVAHRDGGCRFPGCDRRVAWCDAHHIRWWRLHGETKLDNLILLCSRHHHLVHRRRWQLHLDPITAELTVTFDDGLQRTSRPHPGTGPPGTAPPAAA